MQLAQWDYLVILRGNTAGDVCYTYSLRLSVMLHSPSLYFDIY